MTSLKEIFNKMNKLETFYVRRTDSLITEAEVRYINGEIEILKSTIKELALGLAYELHCDPRYKEIVQGIFKINEE